MSKLLMKLSGTPLWGILLLSLSLKILVFCYIGPWHKEVVKEKILTWTDAMEYETLAENLLSQHKFTVPNDTLNAKHLSEIQQTWLIYNQAGTFRVPVYPVLIASVYWITGIKPYIPILLQVFYSLISLWLVYRICLNLFNQKIIATLACLLCSLDIHSIYCASLFAPDTLITLLFLACIYFWVGFLTTENKLQLILSAVFLGLGTLTKPVSIFYPLVILFFLFLFLKCSFNKKLLYSGIYMVSFMAVVGIWVARNYSEYNYISISTQDGSNLALCNVTFSEAKQMHQPIDSVKVKYQRKVNALGFLNNDNPFYRSKLYRTVAFPYITHHWMNYIKCNLEGATVGMYFSLGYMGMAKMFQWTDKSSPERSISVNTDLDATYKNLSMDWKQTTLGIIIFISLLIQYSLALWGVYALAKDKQYKILLFILVTISYFTAVTGIIGNYRYKLPVVPFICILAGYGCFYIIKKNRTDKKESRIS